MALGPAPGSLQMTTRGDDVRPEAVLLRRITNASVAGLASGFGPLRRPPYSDCTRRMPRDRPVGRRRLARSVAVAWPLPEAWAAPSLGDAGMVASDGLARFRVLWLWPAEPLDGDASPAPLCSAAPARRNRFTTIAMPSRAPSLRRQLLLPPPRVNTKHTDTGTHTAQVEAHRVSSALRTHTGEGTYLWSVSGEVATATRSQYTRCTSRNGSRSTNENRRVAHAFRMADHTSLMPYIMTAFITSKSTGPTKVIGALSLGSSTMGDPDASAQLW